MLLSKDCYCESPLSDPGFSVILQITLPVEPQVFSFFVFKIISFHLAHVFVPFMNS